MYNLLMQLDNVIGLCMLFQYEQSLLDCNSISHYRCMFVSSKQQSVLMTASRFQSIFKKWWKNKRCNAASLKIPAADQ